MDRIKMWAIAIVALGLLANCATLPRQSPETVPTAKLNTTTPAEAENLWEQGEKAQKAGKAPAAIAAWERIIRNYPTYSIAARSYYAISNLYLTQGQADKALQYLDYLIYAYPGWEDIGQAKLLRLRAMSVTGKKKQVLKEAMPLWDASKGNPDVQTGLSVLMAGVYGGEGDVSTAFDWLTAGFGVAKTQDQNKSLTQATLNLLNGATSYTLQRLLKKNQPDFMKVFLYYRLAQLDRPEGQSEAARQNLAGLISRNPSHPLAPEIKGTPREPVAPVPSPAEPATQVNAERVGCLVPLDGPFAKYGDMVLKGLNLASEEWNETHPNQRVTLVVRESQTDPATTTQSFEKLVSEDGVLAIIGPLGTQSAKTVVPMANKWGIPLLALTQQEEQVQGNHSVVYVFLDNRLLVQTLVRYCKDRLGFTRFAVLYPDDRYGQSLSKIFSEVVKESGGNLLASVPYKDKSTDFREPIEKLLNIAKKNSPPAGIESTPFDVLFIPDQVQTLALIAPQLPARDKPLGRGASGASWWRVCRASRFCHPFRGREWEAER
jgi:hypothetical protein